MSNDNSSPLSSASIQEIISAQAVETVANENTVASPDRLDENELWAAVEDAIVVWDDVAGDMIEKYVNHGEEYGTPSVIRKTDNWIMFYVSVGEWDATVDELERLGHDRGLAASVPSVFDRQARRYGADPNAIGSMDALAVRREDSR